MSNQSLRSASKSILNGFKAGRLSFEQAQSQLIARGCKSWVVKLEQLEAEELASYSMSDIFYGKDEETVDAVEAVEAIAESFEAAEEVAVQTTTAQTEVVAVQEGRTLTEVIKAHQPKSKTNIFSKAIKSVGLVVSIAAIGVGLGVGFNAPQTKAPAVQQPFTTI